MTTWELDASPFAEDVRAVAAHYGVAATDVVSIPAQGQVNLTVFLGGELVLRLPRTARAAGLLAKEAEVIPLVQGAGVPTADLVSHDPSLRIASVPYLVLRRVHGLTLAEQPPDAEHRRRTLGSLGEVLVRLHQVRLSRVGPLAAIPAPFAFLPAELLGELVAAGEIGRTQHDWLLEQFAALRPGGPAQTDPVLVHRDVTAPNVIVDRHGRVAALLDWGDAEWGSPARDLVGLPIRALPDLLRGYRSALGAAPPGSAGDDDLERDALWYHLYLALTRLLKRPSTSADRNWAAPRTATLLDLLAFTAGGTRSWPDLLR